MDVAGHDAYKNPSDAGMRRVLPRWPCWRSATLQIRPFRALGATAADQQRMREVMAYVLSRISTTVVVTVTATGANLMALVRYAQSGGPDIGGVGMPPAGAPYVDLATAIRNLTDRFLPTGANPQNGSGYWCYGPEVAMGCSDSSTTQFAVAGLTRPVLITTGGHARSSPSGGHQRRSGPPRRRAMSPTPLPAPITEVAAWSAPPSAAMVITWDTFRA